MYLIINLYVWYTEEEFPAWSLPDGSMSENNLII